MKIAFSIAHMGIGGAQRVTLNLIHWINKYTNNEVLLFIGTSKKVSDFAYSLDGINFYKLPDSKIIKIKTLRSYLLKEKPDVLITMGMPDTIYDSLACIGLSLKHIVSERNDPRHFGGKSSTKWLSRLLACFADGYVFQTKDAKDYYCLPCFKKGTIIPNPLIGLEQMPSKPYQGERNKKIVTVGRLNVQKNHPLLVNAFSQIADEFPEYKLVIYGEGPTRDSLIDLVDSLGLHDRVELPGSISDVFSKIYESSLFVLSSDFEGMPNALMEALALGIPCISTDCPCGGPKELIQDGVSGLLVPTQNQESLANAMRRVLRFSHESKMMSVESFKIREKLCLDRVANQWLDYFYQTIRK